MLLLVSGLLGQSSNPAPGPLFDDSQVSKMELFLPADSVAWLLDDENRWNNRHIRAMMIHTHTLGVDSVHNVGVRLRGNTSRSAQKKSWKISVNTFVPGRKHMGVEKINLNGQHNDPSISRAKICSDLLGWLELPAIRANHVKLYINGLYMGLYLNTEQIDENFVKSRFGNNDGNLFKCTYPADLQYWGEDPSYYDLDQEKPPYELSSYTGERDYGDLIHFIDVLNNVEPIADLPCQLEEIFNVDQYLKYIVFDILTGNWDGPLYNKNNFYLYHNTATGLFEYLPFDLDNTLGIDWFNKDWSTRDIYQWSNDFESRPLYDRILEVNEYKARFSYYMKQALSTVYNIQDITAHLITLQDQLAPFVLNDVFYTDTYGFEYEDFLASFFDDVGWNHVHYSINEFVDRRAASAILNVNSTDINPIIREHVPSVSFGIGQVSLSANIEDDENISTAVLYYKEQEKPEFTAVEMNVNGNEYEAAIAFLDEGIEMLQYYIEATDNEGQSSLYPRCGTKVIDLRSSSKTIAINELLAANNDSNTDEAGEYDDWLELYNYGNIGESLGGMWLTDNEANPTKWQLPEVQLDANDYLLIWLDNDEEQGALHGDFKLSASGEFAGLYDVDSTFIDGLDFPLQSDDVSYGRLPNGIGEFVFMHPTPGSFNNPLSNDVTTKSNFHIFPNPATEHIVVNLVTPVNDGYLYIFDSSGSTISKTRLLVQDEAVPVGHLPSGIYTISVLVQGRTVMSKRLIKL